jgi:hypothetical protein
LAIATPLAIFVLGFAIWGGVWLYIKSEVETRVTGWLAAEAAAGRPHQCPQRDVGGFPFRIEVRCANPIAIIATPAGPAEVRLGGATFVAQVYRPEHVIADLRSPFILAQGGTDLGTVEFQRAQASLHSTNGVIERFSLVLDRPIFTRVQGGRADAGADQIELHARHTPTVAAQVRDFDMAVSARRLGPAGARPDQAADLNFSGTARRWPDPAATGSDGLVAQWARSGGIFEVQGLRLTRGNGVLAANGTLAFTASGRAQGEFRATVTDANMLFGGLAIPGVGDAALILLPALALVGRPTEVDGRRGTEVQLRIDEGMLSIGAVQVLAFPPVF